MWNMNRSDENTDKNDINNRNQLSNISSLEIADTNSMNEQQKQQDQEEQIKLTELNKIDTIDISVVGGGGSSGIDSGFMSGPQLSGYDGSSGDEIERQPQQHQRHNNKKLNKKQQQQQQKEEKKLNITSTTFDSGCLEVDNDDQDISIDSGLLLEEHTNKNITDSSRENQQQQQQQQHMIVDSGVNSGTAIGLNEWFCNLSLQDNPNSGSTKTKLNNLNSKQKQQQQKQPWQIYYQQNSDGDTYLHIACITGYIDVALALIQLAPHPCLLDIKNDDGLTALHIAVITEQINLIRLLLIGGASIIQRDHNGNTPLHLACTSGNLDCVKALTQPINKNEMKKFNLINTKFQQQYQQHQQQQQQQNLLLQYLELRNYDGEYCIHLATKYNHLNVLKYLLSIGANINAKEFKSGRTILHIAIEMSNESIVNYLIDNQNDENSTNDVYMKQQLNLEEMTYSGLTAYQLATILNYSQIQMNLEKHGAEIITPPPSDAEDDDDDDDDGENDNTELLYNNHQSSSLNNGNTAINVS